MAVCLEISHLLQVNLHCTLGVSMYLQKLIVFLKRTLMDHLGAVLIENTNSKNVLILIRVWQKVTLFRIKFFAVFTFW